LGDHGQVTIADPAESYFAGRATVLRDLDGRQNASASSISGGQ
jgi:hypothetical protein